MASNPRGDRIVRGIDVTAASFTVLFLIVTWSGFGLLAVSGIAVLRHVLRLWQSVRLPSHSSDSRHLADAALGLPPELPGMPAPTCNAVRSGGLPRSCDFRCGRCRLTVSGLMSLGSAQSHSSLARISLAPRCRQLHRRPFRRTLPRSTLLASSVLSFLGWMLCGSILMLLSGGKTPLSLATTSLEHCKFRTPRRAATCFRDFFGHSFSSLGTLRWPNALPETRPRKG